MQDFVLLLARRVAGFLAIIMALGSLGIAQQGDPMNWMYGVIRAMNLSGIMSAPVESNGITGMAQVDAGCSAHYLILQITLDRNLPFNSSPGILVSVDGRLRPAPEFRGGPGGGGNVTSVIFSDATVNQARSEFNSIHSDPANLDHPNMAVIDQNVNAFVNSLMNLNFASYSAGTLAEAYRARSIKLFLPLANGERPPIEIRPQNASFSAFARHCGVTIPGSSGSRALREQNTVPGSPVADAESGPAAATSVPATQPLQPDPTVRQAGIRAFQSGLAASGASSIPVYRDDLLGEYLKDGHLYSIKFKDGKPIAVYEYDKTTHDLKAATLYTGPSPRLITGGTDARKRADAVLKKYLAVHPDRAVGTADKK